MFKSKVGYEKIIEIVQDCLSAKKAAWNLSAKNMRSDQRTNSANG